MQFAYYYRHGYYHHGGYYRHPYGYYRPRYYRHPYGYYRPRYYGGCRTTSVVRYSYGQRVVVRRRVCY
jgi:hypothetical protein